MSYWFVFTKNSRVNSFLICLISGPPPRLLIYNRPESWLNSATDDTRVSLGLLGSNFQMLTLVTDSNCFSTRRGYAVGNALPEGPGWSKLHWVGNSRLCLTNGNHDDDGRLEVFVIRNRGRLIAYLAADIGIGAERRRVTLFWPIVQLPGWLILEKASTTLLVSDIV